MITDEPFLAGPDLGYESEGAYVTDTTGPERRAKEDELIVIRCQLGERAALDELAERWHPPLWKYVRRLAGDDDAKDVVQDVWLRVLRGIGRLRDGSRLRPWLFGIARHVLMDRLRHQYAAPFGNDIDVADLAADLPADSFEEELGAIEHELARLPAIEREVLTLFYLRELSLAEVAEVLEVPVGTVKSRLFRARRLLRRGLDSEGTRA
jgi:RNA polymerase sigma-70 factor (ECF subfamily)